MLKTVLSTWVVGLCFVLSSTAFGQDDRHPRFDARVVVGIPAGSAGDQLNSGGGLAGSLLFPIGDGPVSLGADLSILSFNSASSTGSFGGTTPIQGINPSASTAVLSGHLLLRVQPNSGTFRPYADLMLGTNQSFTDVNVPQGANIQTSSYDFGLGYGAGAGLDVTIIDRDSDFFLNNLEFTGGLRVLGSTLALAQGLPSIGGGASGSVSGGSWMFMPQLGVMTSF